MITDISKPAEQTTNHTTNFFQIFSAVASEIQQFSLPTKERWQIAGIIIGGIAFRDILLEFREIKHPDKVERMACHQIMPLYPRLP